MPHLGFGCRVDHSPELAKGDRVQAHLLAEVLGSIFLRRRRGLILRSPRHELRYLTKAQRHFGPQALGGGCGVKSLKGGRLFDPPFHRVRVKSDMCTFQSQSR
jgi:hypothetical protein